MTWGKMKMAPMRRTPMVTRVLVLKLKRPERPLERFWVRPLVPRFPPPLNMLVKPLNGIDKNGTVKVKPN